MAAMLDCDMEIPWSRGIQCLTVIRKFHGVGGSMFNCDKEIPGRRGTRQIAFIIEKISAIAPQK